jgi:imidazolonepropionase-like amidohydrolase
MRKLVLLAFVLLSVLAVAQAPAVRQFITVDAPVFALTHVKVIDGTGAPAKDDQTIIVSAGKIQAIGDTATVQPPAGAKVMEMRGYTVIPGLVGMHDHLFYPEGGIGVYVDLVQGAPPLYLAGGVTTIRTTGTIEGYTDIEVKRAIDAGRIVGPKMHVTAPYLEGPGAFTLQMHELTGADDARRLVEYWATEGADNFKAYMDITRAELSAALEEAHKRGLKITGHLCSIGFREAAALGIDDLEHGLMVDTEFLPNKQPDVCPSARESRQALMSLDVKGPDVQQTIRELVAHKVAVTSTLPVFEISVPGRPPYRPAVLDAMSTDSRLSYLSRHAMIATQKDSPMAALFRKEMDFEYAFAQAGGLLLAGLDPTGYGGVVPGFGDQRELELLVEAGFTPIEAIKIYTYNGAQYLGELDRIGSLAPGKQADMVLIKGDPASNITDIEKVDTVFKDGVGYDSAKLIQAAKGKI